MSILFKFFGVFFIFLFVGGGLSYLFGTVFEEDTDNFYAGWFSSVIFYTIMIVIIMGHYGYFNQ